MHQLWHDLTHPWYVALMTAATAVFVILRTWVFIRDIRADLHRARQEEERRLANEAYDREPRPVYTPPTAEELAAYEAKMLAAGWTKDWLVPGVWTKSVSRRRPAG